MMSIYPAEQACPEWFAILSASGTVSFVSSNETERHSRLLIVCRSKGGRGEPIGVSGLCLSSGFQTCCSFVFATRSGWSCTKTLSARALNRCCSIMKPNATHLLCTGRSWHYGDMLSSRTSWDIYKRMFLWSHELTSRRDVSSVCRLLLNHSGGFSRPTWLHAREQHIYSPQLALTCMWLVAGCRTGGNPCIVRWTIRHGVFLLGTVFPFEIKHISSVLLQWRPLINQELLQRMISTSECKNTCVKWYLQLSEAQLVVNGGVDAFVLCDGTGCDCTLWSLARG